MSTDQSKALVFLIGCVLAIVSGISLFGPTEVIFGTSIFCIYGAMR